MIYAANKFSTALFCQHDLTEIKEHQDRLHWSRKLIDYCFILDPAIDYFFI